MEELLAKQWNSYPIPSIALLIALDIVLFIYVLKNIKKISGNSKKKPNEQRQLLDAIAQCKIEAEKNILIQNYNSKYGAEDLKAIHARSPKQRTQAMRRLAHLGELHLYEIKKMIDDKDDGVALRSFHLITQMSDITNLALLEKTMARAAKHRTVFVSSLIAIAHSSNHQILIDLVKTEVPPWVAIASMKALSKAQAGDLLPMLLNAQDNGSAEIRQAANEILNKNPNFQKFAS